MLSKDFRIDIGSDIDYEDLVAIIYYKDQFVAQLSQEEGFAKLVIELPSAMNCKKPIIVQLQEFEEAIAHAKKRLWELRRVEK